MYQNTKNNFFHGIMFHHFHDNKIHRYSQGSVDRESFVKIINLLGKDNILNSDKFLEKLIDNKLKNNEVCITFDDSLKCQYDIALPILEDYKIKAFFFLYTSIFEGKHGQLEIYRYFRNNYYSKINDFYNDFYKFLEIDINKWILNNQNIINEYKAKFPFYSKEDIKFKLIRNFFIDENLYKSIMEEMFHSKNFKPDHHISNLFVSKSDVIKIKKLGHEIGLHSHSHSTTFNKFNYDEQKIEYIKNLNILKKIFNSDCEIQSMSHPCGSYNHSTLEILKKMDIKIGFKNSTKSDNNKPTNHTNLEIAREDSGNILKLI